ncbi:hypothetical protein [Chryseobacterium schmidteae]|uniref:hypothetical protein n=1 Tax=Chryseobacterium schmidteae TaxID=2730404 RepID=UPI00158DF2B8|nr:hypothetical protein [Chryseobacterium schmidteae]
MKNINVFGYATFGTPNGFTQSCIYGNKNLEKALKTFDLKTDAIQLLSPNDRIYSIRKEGIADKFIISYSVYTYAKEKNSNRTGTFIGTSLIFSDEIADENLILNSLHQIHQKLKNNNVSNNILNINHSKEFNLTNVFDQDFEKIKYNSRKIGFIDWQSSDKNLVIFTNKLDNNSIQNLFKKALEILPKYETLFFIGSKEIAEFVSQKRLFRLIDVNILEEEIQNFQTEIKQQLINTISKLKQKSKKIEDEGRKEYENLKKQIEQDEKTHLENGKKIEKADKNLAALNSLYANFLRKFNEFISALESGKQIEEVNNSIKQIEKEFYDEKKKLDYPTQISSLTNNRNTSYFPLQRPSLSEFSHHTEEKQSKNAVFLIISFVLNLLLIGALIFFTMFYEKEKKQEIIPDVSPVSQETVVNETSEKDSLWKSKLNPLPNKMALNAENKNLDLNKLTDSTTHVEEIVDLIFEKNKIIKDVYQFQKDDYADDLIKENIDAFDSKKVLIRKDLLLKIPFYLKPSDKNVPEINTYQSADH